jgi:hypothetical protein
MRTVSLLYCPCLALANQIEVGMGAEVEVVNLGEVFGFRKNVQNTKY